MGGGGVGSDRHWRGKLAHWEAAAVCEDPILGGCGSGGWQTLR